MNVLLLVMGMLMLLSIMTYARLDIFRSFSGTQTSFIDYMTKNERKYPNKIANEWYKSIVVNPTSSKSSSKTPANSRLNWKLLVDKKKREKEENAFEVFKSISRNLIVDLFQKQPFFIKAQEKYPNLVDRLLNAIIDAADKSDLKFNKATDLSNLDLNDNLLNEIFYQMIKGYIIPGNESSEPKASKSEDDEIKTPDEETEDLENEEAQEFQAEPGRISLLNYITMRGKNKIRIYLASKPILFSIFGDDDVVKEIIKSREDLYNQIKKEKDQKIINGYSEKFQNEFIGRSPPEFQNYLDFTLSKVDPSSYGK